MANKKVFNGSIYILKDPLSGSIRYVGKCEDGNLNKRLSNHKSEAYNSKKKNHRYDWIKSLQKNNLEPIIELIQDGFQTKQKLCEAEIFLIQFYKDIGLDLVNGTKGGDGGKPFLGKKHSQEWIENQRQRMSGKNSPNFGKCLSEQTKEKISKGNLGKKRTEEQKIRYSLAKKGIKFSEEHMRNLRKPKSKKLVEEILVHE